jgi:LuxR family transcriptional regulator, maltose regulon positive regulatory protein
MSETLTHSETQVLIYLPTHLSAQEIADELYLSVNTVKTHQRHLYRKLGASSRTQAVRQAQALGLLAPFFVPVSPVNQLVQAGTVRNTLLCAA